MQAVNSELRDIKIEQDICRRLSIQLPVVVAFQATYSEAQKFFESSRPVDLPTSRKDTIRYVPKLRQNQRAYFFILREDARQWPPRYFV
jgi:hypothetical protein